MVPISLHMFKEFLFYIKNANKQTEWSSGKSTQHNREKYRYIFGILQETELI